MTPTGYNFCLHDKPQVRTQEESEDQVNKLSHYPDYSTIPHLPNLQDMVSERGENSITGIAGGSISGKISDQDTLNDSHQSGTITEIRPTREVVLNASRLKVESEIA